MSDALSLPEHQEELRLMIQKLARRIRSNRGDEMVSDSQLSVLFALVLEEPQSPGTLALREHVTPPSMTRTLNELEKRGLIRREPDSDDARKVTVVLTEAGEKITAETRRVRAEWFSQRVAALSEEERRLIADAIPVLRRLAEEL